MKRNIGTIICFVAAAVLITVGLINSQHISVLNKAIKICMECVGIG